MPAHGFSITEPIWPKTLRLPDRPPKLVYLDLNHWISLSKAYQEHPDGQRHRNALDNCLQAVRDQSAIFPISGTLYVEISKIRQHRQRLNLREVLEPLSQFNTLIHLSYVVQHEIEALLDHMIGPSARPMVTIDLLGWGVNWAFAKVANLRIKTADGNDVTDTALQSFPGGQDAFRQLAHEADLRVNRMAIDGPTPQEEAELRSHGWDPNPALALYDQAVHEELAQARRFDQYSRWRRGRTRDVISAREFIAEQRQNLAGGLIRRGYSSDDEFFSKSREELSTALSSMPSFDVSVTIKTSLHRDGNHKWSNNDIYDIHTLALAIPYCDVLVTDRSMSEHANRSHLAGRYNTNVISSLSDLESYL